MILTRYVHLFFVFFFGFWICEATGEASPKKALIVGSNLAPAHLERLRYTQNDVEKVAEVLNELGGVAGHDIVLLQDPSYDELERALEEFNRNIEPNTQLIFYYSGHADSRDLLLGKEKFPLQRIRDFLDDERAQIRLGIIDACQSGALVRQKGGKMLLGVDIRLNVEPSLNGAVLITSSSLGEASLEVEELGGSLFTHFFISGLRGAADDNQDGLVTLEEAFSYGSHQTLNHSSVSRTGAQHPTFEYNLSGQRQLVMSVLNQ
ncbi:MAG: caspase family protein, partial [Myxococcota bacterium]|nr:caspase family protein [Myxococcota bacterium]